MTDQPESFHAERAQSRDRRVRLDPPDVVPQAAEQGVLKIDPAAAALIPENLAERHGVIALGFEEGALVVAIADPGDVVALDDVRIATGYPVKAVSATPEQIAAAARKAGHAAENIGGIIESVQEDLDEDDAMPRDAGEEGPIIRLVNALIARGIASNASDIHIEPNENDVRIRYRIDGVLHEAMRVPRALMRGVASRLKIMGEIDIAERRVPQDGRAKVNAGRETVDLRIATLPTMFGEKCVIRVLRSAAVELDLSSLGFADGAVARLTRSILRPQGMVLVTGPTGSGKTTTLYALLKGLNTSDRNIITVEDPVEYRIPGAYQIQVNRKAGLTFAAAMRSILRSDPDVLLVGEVRDRETAQLAVDAALTGHQVLSSLHTNDAPAALVRLTDMGIEPYLVASAVSCVVNQRLVRVLCQLCCEPYVVGEEIAPAYGLRWPSHISDAPLMKAGGCGSCAGTGYSGRTVVQEVMPVTTEIAAMIAARASTDAIAATAREQGMRSLFEDGIRQVLSGRTSLEEVLRVIGPPAMPGMVYDAPNTDDVRRAEEIFAYVQNAQSA